MGNIVNTKTSDILLGNSYRLDRLALELDKKGFKRESKSINNAARTLERVGIVLERKYTPPTYQPASLAKSGKKTTQQKVETPTSIRRLKASSTDAITARPTPTGTRKKIATIRKTAARNQKLASRG